jgi:hypothetical protein
MSLAETANTVASPHASGSNSASVRAVFSGSGVLSFRRERVCGDLGSGYHAFLPSRRPHDTSA